MKNLVRNRYGNIRIGAKRIAEAEKQAGAPDHVIRFVIAYFLKGGSLSVKAAAHECARLLRSHKR